MNRVIITGGTGLIGRMLSAELARNGYEPILLSRNPAGAHHLPMGVQAVYWDGRTEQGWGKQADGATAIVNLAGESIGIPPIPWTAGKKQRIRQSRIDAGCAVTEAVKQAVHKPRVVIQASAIGFYGLHGDEPVTEESRPGADFMSRVAVAWEASTDPIESMGVRRVIIRTGLPLTLAGGVLPYLMLPFRFFVGGPLGSGQQYLSWIHMADEIGAIRFLIENESARGPFNLTAPNPVTNAEFARVLGRVMHRPAAIPAPAFAMKLAFGEMARLLLLGGQRVIPERLSQHGFKFKFIDVEAALRDLIK